MNQYWSIPATHYPLQLQQLTTWKHTETNGVCLKRTTFHFFFSFFLRIYFSQLKQPQQVKHTHVQHSLQPPVMLNFKYIEDFHDKRNVAKNIKMVNIGESSGKPDQKLFLTNLPKNISTMKKLRTFAIASIHILLLETLFESSSM